MEKNIENAHYRIHQIRKEVALKMISTINTLMDSGRIDINDALLGRENERQLLGAINEKYYAIDSNMTLKNAPIIEGQNLFDLLNSQIEERGHDLLLDIVKTLGAVRASWLIQQTWGYDSDTDVCWKYIMTSPTILELVENKEIIIN